MREEYIEIRPGRKLRVWLVDNQNHHHTKIFLFHGLAGRSMLWKRIIPQLKNYGDLIIPDLLGHGKSGKPKGTAPYKVTEMYQDIEAIFNRYAGEVNYIIAHSLGAAWTMQLANKFPDRIKKLVLISPLPSQPKKKIPGIFRLMVWMLKIIKTRIVSTFVHLMFTEKSDSELIRKEMRAENKNSVRVIRPLILDLANLPYVDVSSIKIPTLVIVTDGDRVVPAAESRRFYRKMPDVKFEVIKQVGHLPMLEKPYILSHLIREFLFG